MLQALLPEAVEGIMEPGAGWLLTYLLHSTVLLGVAWLLDRSTGVGAQPRLRSWMWTAALIGGIVTATASSAGWSPSVLSVEVTEAEKAVLELSAAGTPARAESRPDRPEAAGSGTDATPGDAGPAASLRSPHRSDVHSPVAWLRASGHDWPYLLVLTAVAVAAASLLGQGTRLAGFFLRLRDRTPVDSGPLHDALEGLMREGGDSRPVSLSRSGALSSPVALPGREICVPARLPDELGERETKALVAHELAHVRSGHPMMLLALAAVEALLTVQPLNRVARRRLVETTESRVDDRVRRQGLGSDLAATLVTVGRWMRGRRPGGPVAGLARESELEARVRRLLDGPDGSAEEQPAGPAVLTAAVAATGVLLLVAPGMRIATSPHAPHVAGPAGADDGRRTRCDPALPVSSSREAEDCSARRGMTAGTRRLLGEGEGVGLYLEVDAPDASLELRLRPGRGPVRVFGSSGRQLTLPVPPARDAPDGGVATLHLEAEAGGEHVLYVPPSVRRLAVVVNGRPVATSGSPAAGSGLPRIVVPPEHGAKPAS